MRARAALWLAATACASYRVLPPAPLGDGIQPIAVTYESSRALFFKSRGEDGAIARVFAGGAVALATVTRPQQGLYASGDAGRTWTFAAGAFDFREVIFAEGRLYARGATQVFHSEDQGRTWAARAVVAANDRLDALALGPDGALYTAGRSQLYVSTDGARTFRTLNVQVPNQPAWRVRSIVPDPAHPRIVYVSLRTEPQAELLPRFTALLDYSSDEAVSALKLVDTREAPPRFGQEGDGVYVTLDGGGLWKKTGFALDGWLALHEGALYGVAAEPILQAAFLMRRHPDLAGAAERQFKGARADAAVLRAALPFPGRDALLAGPVAAALVYRSSDGGSTWARADNLPPPVALVLRAAVERGGQDLAHVAVPQLQQKPEQKVVPGIGRGSASLRSESGTLQQGRYRGLPRSPRTEQAASPAPRALTPDTLLAFVDPLRLLARFNSGAPLTAVSGEAFVAPTQQGWEALVAALAAASANEGEISLGPGQAPGASFELLRSADGGATWAPLAAAPPALSAQSLASARGVIYLVRRDGRAFRVAP